MDRLGSARSGPDGTFAYYPYGDEQGASGNSRMKFGTYYRDQDGMDYAMARRCSSGTGSFVTPDPAGNAASYQMIPRTWNRYSYAAGVLSMPEIAPGAPSVPDAERILSRIRIKRGAMTRVSHFPELALMAGGGSIGATGLDACEEPGPDPGPEPAATYSVSLRLVDDCVGLHGLPPTTALTGVFTLAVEYQILVNSQPAIRSQLVAAGATSIFEKVTVTSGPAISAGSSWCLSGYSCDDIGGISSTGLWWDELAGNPQGVRMPTRVSFLVRLPTQPQRL